MVILKVCIPVYLCIIEITVLHKIIENITISAGLPLINGYTRLPVNENGIFGLLDIMFSCQARTKKNLLFR